MPSDVTITGTVSGTTGTVPGTTTKGLWVDPRGSTTLIQVTPVVSASAIYALKDAIGGIMTFAGATRVTAGGGILETVVIVDKDQERAGMDLVLFSASPAGTATDNNGFDPDDAALLTCVGHVPINSGDYVDFTDNSVATRTGIGMAYTCAATSLFGSLVARSTPTYTGTSDIVVTIGVIPD